MLRCDSIAVRLGDRQILRNVSLQISSGSLAGILGPNGSGKTTLLRTISGALKPDTGIVTFNEQSLHALPPIQRAQRLAVVPQETQLAFDYSVIEIVLMGRYPHLGSFQFEGPGDLASAHAALQATGTDHLADRSFATLSGGEKQRVVIASALAQLDEGADNARSTERLLLLDEPTASLDLRYQLEVAALLQRLHARGDITIVLTTHDVQFAAKLCSQLILLGDGSVLADGAPASVLTTTQISALYGIDAANAAPYAIAEQR